MVFLKACPRCGGDMYRERDMYGAYTSCLNCGYLLDVQDREMDGVAGDQRARKKAA